MQASPSDPYRLDKGRLRLAFDRAASAYEARAVLQHTVAERMLERLDWMKLRPAWLLDAGAGTGHASRLLARRYREARLVVLDIAQQMLLEARRRAPRFRSRQSYVRADVERLPIAAASLDLIFSNLALQWCNDLEATFAEFRRALKRGGLLLFSTFGPDTLRELRACWAAGDEGIHVHLFIDMHDLGDALIRSGLSSPVLDTEYFTLTYRDVYALMRDLKSVGATNVALGRRRALTGKGQLAAVARAYEAYRHLGVLPATYEVIYGHAWVPERGARRQDGSTVASFPLARLRRRAGPGA